MFKLQWPHFLDPFWFQQVRANPEHRGRVLENGSVEVLGEIVAFLEGELPPAGTDLVITPGPYDLMGESEAEYCARRAAENADREAAQARLEQESYELQERAEVRNARLNIPVRWTAGRKAVLSGLSENSWGHGRNSRSVIHILLLEVLSDARLKRPAKTFLCTNPSGSNGQQYLDLETWSKGPGGCYVSEVTCQRCLTLAERWQEPSLRVEPELPADARDGQISLSHSKVEPPALPGRPFKGEAMSQEQPSTVPRSSGRGGR